MTEVVDSTAEELVDTDIVRHHEVVAVGEREVTADDLVHRVDIIREGMNRAMQKDVDYGVIPGTGSKPTLLKPGAEKLGVLFKLDIQLENEKTFEGEHLTVTSKATVFHAPTGTRLGFGEGLCTTREKKYGKRNAGLVCPDCGKENIRKSKTGGGWYCWAKTDGCGANFDAGDTRISSQTPGTIDNPELPDTWNTVVKMAEKRARIDAVLAVTGASALFTQDVEDHQDFAPPSEPEAKGPALGPLATEDQEASLERALCFLLDESDPDSFAVKQVFGQIRAEGDGKIRRGAVQAVARTAKALKLLRETPPGDAVEAAKAYEAAVGKDGK